MPNDMEEPYVLHSIFFGNCTHSSLENIAALSETVTSGKLSAANDCLKMLLSVSCALPSIWNVYPTSECVQGPLLEFILIP